MRLSKTVIMKVLAAVGIATAPAVAHADFCYNEKVEAVIWLNTGQISFRTDKTCTNWCFISTSLSEDAQNRAMAQLLTAFTNKQEVTTGWSTTTSCAAQPSGSSPTQIVVGTI